VSLVRIRPTEPGKRIPMATNRVISFYEARNNPRIRDYKFRVIEMRVDMDGKGEVAQGPASKMRFNKKGELEIEHYGIAPARLVEVQLQ